MEASWSLEVQMSMKGGHRKLLTDLQLTDLSLRGYLTKYDCSSGT